MSEENSDNSFEDIEPMENDLSELLTPLKENVTPPSEVQSSLWERLIGDPIIAANLPKEVPQEPMGEQDPADEPASTKGSTEAATSTSDLPAAPDALLQAGVTGGTIASKIITAGVLLALGGAGGVGVGYVTWGSKVQTTKSPSEKVIREEQAFEKVETKPEEPRESEVIRPEKEKSSSKSSSLIERKKKKAEASSQKETKQSERAKQRAELEQAENALSRGQIAASMRILSDHAKDYPNSNFKEEREFLMIRALLANGQRERAEVRASSFFRRYPKSLFRKKIERSLSP